MEKNNIHRKSSHRRHPGLKVLRIIGMTMVGLTFAVVFAFIFGLLVKVLWNWLMPTLFNLPLISYWQAFGLLILAKLLFGGFGPHKDHPHNSHFHKKIENRWHRMIGVEDCGDWGSKFPPENWRYYKEFWHEEGKQAFEDYIEKQKSEKKSDS